MGKKKRKKLKKTDEIYVEKIKEWQKNQYSPGHYVGGEIPPMLLNPGRPAWLGWTLIITAIIYGVIIGLMIKKGMDMNQLAEIILVIVCTYTLIVLQLLAGVRYVRKSIKQKNQLWRVKKTIIMIVTMFLVVVACSIYIYILSLNQDKIVITSRNQYSVRQNGDRNLVYLKEKDMILKTGIDDYLRLWMMDVNTDKEEGFEIYYQWSDFSPRKGKIIRMIESTK